ncbi:MAG: hypothetical protein OXP69_22275 [Spirochaetaceae bacterium]|nr:hypothetical protein [Spirochaetaceae bacterium]
MPLLLRHLWLVARVGSRHLGLGRGGLQAAALLAAGGLAAGTATLLVVLAVMNGFQLGFIENIVEIGSYHLRVAARRAAPGGGGGAAPPGGVCGPGGGGGGGGFIPVSPRVFS